MPESLERYPGMIGTKVRFECEITPGIFIISIKQVKKEIENYFYFYNYVRINERLGMPPMEYYYRHKDDENLILDLHNKEYSNIYDLIEFAEGSLDETYN